MGKNWIRIGEAEDVAGSVRHALRAAQMVQDDPLAWKWVALAIHSALQGACICHLTTTAAPIGAVTPRNACDWIEFFERSRTDAGIKSPRTQLMGLPDLLKAIRKPHSAGDCSNDAGVPISDAELAWLRRFHEQIRNQFVHFEPMSWSLEVSGIPELAVLIARIIETILAMGWGFRHQCHAWREALAADLARLASPLGWTA
jgi:hypothetical protein